MVERFSAGSAHSSHRNLFRDCFRRICVMTSLEPNIDTLISFSVTRFPLLPSDKLPGTSMEYSHSSRHSSRCGHPTSTMTWCERYFEPQNLLSPATRRPFG